MLRPLAFTATVIGLLAAGPLLADGGGHTHPHQGHAVAGGGAYHHTHGTNVRGVVHTHEINGAIVKHRHGQSESATARFNRATARANARFESRERLSRSRYQVGAGFGPYSVAEYQTRVGAGQPGLTRHQEPWPGRRYRNQD